MFKKIFLFTLSLGLVLGNVANAENRVQWLQNEQPPSSWLNIMEKNKEIALGQWIWDAVGRGNTNGFFTNLTIAPNTGMYVAAGPANTNQVASLYQIGPADNNPFGSGAGQLSADPTVIFHQGLLLSTGNSVGPLAAPTTSGQSVKDLIECQTQIVDQTLQTVNFVSSTNIASTGSAYRDRADIIYCQAKVGTPATTGTEVAPTVDTGWVAVATVDIPYGTSTITSGMIAMQSGFNGFLPAGSANQFVDTTTVDQVVTASKKWNGTMKLYGGQTFNSATSVATGFAGVPGMSADGQTHPGLLANIGDSSSAGLQFLVNGTLNGAAILPSGAYKVSSTTQLANNLLTVNNATWNGTTVAGSGTYLALNAASGAIRAHYGDASTDLNLSVYDGGTTNKATLSYANGLQFSAASSNTYGQTNTTVYGNLAMPNQAAGQCAQFDASHNLVAAGGACGLTSGTISSVSSGNPNVTATTASGSVTIGFASAPTFNGQYVAQPKNATGYNVYISTSTGTEKKQNGSTPIAIGTNWTEPTSGLVAGSALPSMDSSGGLTSPAAPGVTQAAGGTLTATTYYVEVTYTNSAGETIASSETSFAASANDVITVASPAANNPAVTVASLFWGGDGKYSLDRSGPAFTLTPRLGAANPTLAVAGGYNTGNSTYGPSSMTLAGPAFLNYGTGSSTNAMRLYDGGSTNNYSWVYGTGLTEGSSVYGPTSASINGGLSVGSGISLGGPISGATTGGFSGAVTALQFNGSGAGLTSGSVPQSALGAFAGVNVGGALIGATTGAFSSSVTVGGSLTGNGLWSGSGSGGGAGDISCGRSSTTGCAIFMAGGSDTHGTGYFNYDLNVPGAFELHNTTAAAADLYLGNSGTLHTGSSTYGPTSATASTFSDGGSVATGFPGYAKVMVGNLNSATTVMSWGGTGNATEPSVIGAMGDTVSGVVGNTFEVGIRGVAALLSLDATGTLGLASGGSGVKVGSSTYGPTSATVNGDVHAAGGFISTSANWGSSGVPFAANSGWGIGNNLTNGGSEVDLVTAEHNGYSAGFFYNNGTSYVQSSVIKNDGTYVAGSSQYGPNSASVSGPITAGSYVQAVGFTTGASSLQSPPTNGLSLGTDGSANQNTVLRMQNAGAGFIVQTNNGAGYGAIDGARITSHAGAGAYAFSMVSNASSGYTGIYGGLGGTIAGIQATCLGVDNLAVAGLLALDCSGNMGVNGNYFAASERHLKDHITTLRFDPLDLVDNLQIYQWCYKNAKCKPGESGTNVGPMSDDKTTPAILSGKSHKAINLDNEASIALAAVKELHKQVKSQQAQIDDLRKQVAVLSAQHIVAQHHEKGLLEKLHDFIFGS